MDRLSMPSAMPAEIAERLSDIAAPVLLPNDLKRAREELVEELMQGDKVGRINLEGILEQELNDNYAATLRNLYEHFANIGDAGGDSANLRCDEAGKWMRRLVEHHVDRHPELIQERAEAIDAARLEDDDL